MKRLTNNSTYEVTTDRARYAVVLRRFTRNVTSDHAIRRWQGLAEIRYDELIMERDGKIEFGGYTIRESCHGIGIEKGKDFLGFCDSIAEGKNKIIFKEV